MSFNPSRFSLSQQMTAVIGVALAFQLAFVGSLAYAHFQLEKELEAEAHSKKLVSAGNALISTILRLATNMGFYQFNKEESFKRSFDKDMRELSKRSEELGNLRLDSKDQPEVNMMLKNLDEAFKLFQEVQNIFNSSDEEGKKFAVLQISKQARSLYKVNDEFLARQEAKSVAHQKREAEMRVWVNSIIYGGLTINIALVLGLLFFFTSRTTKRFDTLSNNIVALGAGKDIPTQLGGADELAMLDNVVHAVSKALQEAERAKQEVLAMVTHDLRSPLTSLQLTLNLLASGSMDNSSEKARNMLSRADSSVGKLIQLINDLLDIDKIESGRFSLDIQEVEDASIIAQAVELIQHSADARKITIESRPENIDVNCDEERIIRVITNLLSNAIKFSPDNSTVTVSTSTEGNMILFQVKDQGRGMPPGEEGRIFERYHQVNSANEVERKGSGLGLTICKALIEAHNGTIGATSKEGEGSTFWFRIPIGANETSRNSGKENEQSQSVSSLT
ncbi:MAG TPA: HAMP domain-containing histidine kinase [Candidatus Melainabacteria bacterium]|jgi:signal transduction histidine kinase|nr:HAMP domain-containing histidine kinase [Candidatus Melainabacteria bacterium]